MELRGLQNVLLRIQEIRQHFSFVNPVRYLPSNQLNPSQNFARVMEEVQDNKGTEIRQDLPSKIEEIIITSSKKEALDPALVKALIQVESGFNPRAYSPKGAQGLMQLMPETARALGVSNPFDIQENIAGGVRYLKGLIERVKGDISLALAAYNAGAGAVERYGGIPPYPETQKFVPKVLRLWEEYGR